MRIQWDLIYIYIHILWIWYEWGYILNITGFTANYIECPVFVHAYSLCRNLVYKIPSWLRLSKWYLCYTIVSPNSMFLISVACFFWGVIFCCLPVIGCWFNLAAATLHDQTATLPDQFWSYSPFLLFSFKNEMPLKLCSLEQRVKTTIPWRMQVHCAHV